MLHFMSFAIGLSQNPLKSIRR